MTQHIGFIGLGHMGQPIAARLLDEGYRLKVYNRTAEKAAALVERGASHASTPAQAVTPDGLVITMLADDRALEDVVYGPEGILERLGSGGIHLALSTVSPALARQLAVGHGERGAAYVAAPVFGRPDAAAAGKLWVVLGGDEEAKQRVREVLPAFSQGSYDYGEDPGAANIVKLAGNFLIAAAMEAMAEAFTLAEKNGVDRVQLATMLGETLFGCPIYRNYGKAIAEQRYEPPGFNVELGLKDVDLARRMADLGQVPMPLAAVLHDRLLALVANGHGALDWSAMGLGVSRDAGVT